MCGIFAYTGKKTSAGQIVLEGLKKLEYRGYDSWGIAVVPEGLKKEIVVKKKIGKIGEATVDDLPASMLALGHTRWATHGGVTQANAHPHLDCKKRFALVHNGIIENYQELAKSFTKKHQLLSQTDTEIMVHLIEELAEKYSSEEAVRLAFAKARGLNAIVVLDNKSQQIIAAKTGSPIILTVAGENGYLASDSASLLSISRDLLFLADNEMAVLTSGTITLKNILSGQVLPLHLERVDWKFTESDLGKYPHFMLKEMEEQPKIILSVAKNLAEQTQKLAKKIANKNVYLTGCGTAYFSALTGMYFLSEIANKPSQAIFGSESGLLKHLGSKDILIALSQSGETIDLVESVKSVKVNGTKVVAVVNVLGSTLYRMANEKILLGAGPEKCVLATKSFIAKLSFLLLLAQALAADIKKGQELLEKAAEGIEEILNQKDRIRSLAKILAKKKDIFVIGRDISYPIALESALKIKEVTYLHAEGFAGGELKHGVIALIERGTPCIVLAPQDETYEWTLASAMELKARGGQIIGISCQNNEIFDIWLPIPNIGMAQVFPSVVYAQLLAYYMALELKLDPDKPRNLAKSVTVK